MRVSSAILFFVFALVGSIHSATIPLEERYIGVALPGLSNIIQELKQNLNNSLNEVTDLTAEQRDQLIEELLQDLRDFPNANNIETIKPSQLPQYLSQVREYAEKMTKALVVKAKGLVKSEGTDRREIQHSPTTDKVLSFLKKTFEKALFGITGLTKAQQQELVDEFVSQMKNFPPIKGYIIKYLDDVREFGKNLIDALLAKARALAASNNRRSTRNALPGLSHLIEEVREKINNALQKVNGLTGRQRIQLVEELLQGVRNYPNANGIHTVKPSQFDAYLQQIHDYADKMIVALVAKAQGIVESNKQGKGITRQARFLPGVDKIVEFLKNNLDKALYRLTGVTKEQHKELVDDFVNQMQKFPTPTWQVIIPGNMEKYIEDVRDFGKNLVNALLAKAKAFADLNKSGVSKRDIGEVQRQSRFLPGFDKVVIFLQEKLDAALYKITGVTTEQHLELVNEFVQQMKNFPTINGWELLKPSNVAQYLGDLRQFGQSLVNALVAKAKAFVDINNSGISKRLLFGSTENKVSSLYNSLTNKFRTSLQQISGLTKNHVDQLVAEFSAGLASLPVPPLKEFYNPFKWLQWSSEVASTALELTGTLLKTATQLAKGIVGSILGELDSIVDEVGKTLNPEAFVAQLETLVDSALDKVSGLSEEIKQQLIDEFKTQLEQRTDLKNVNVLKPKQLTEFLKKIKEFCEKTIGEIVTKAEELVKKGEEVIGNVDVKVNVKTRKIEALEMFDKLVQNLYNKLVGEVVRALGTISGLTQVQNDELVEDFKNGLDNFPQPPISEFYNPLRWLSFAGKLTNHALKLTKTILNRARDIVKRVTNNVITDSNTVEKRQISVPSFVTDMHHRMVQTIRNLLEKVTGLTTEQQEALAEEFKQKLSEMPLPPLQFFDFFNPIKWTKYFHELAVYNIDLTREFIDKAVKLVKGTLGEDYEVPDVDTILQRRAAEDRGLVLETVKKAFDAIITNIPGINDEIKSVIIAEFNAELSNFPPPPTSYNPFAWVSYQSKLVAYQGELTQRLIIKAKDLLKEQVDKVNPDLGKYLGRRDAGQA